MKFASFSYDGVQGYGIVHPEEQKILNLTKTKDWNGPKTFLEFVQREKHLEEAKQLERNWLSEQIITDEIIFVNDPLFQWEAPIPKPLKNIFAVGKNYVEHAMEMGGTEAPSYLVIFSKVPTTVTAHQSEVLLHKHVTKEVDYEGELGVIIGKKAFHISKEDAWEYVFGFTIINDVTARDLQRQHQQFLLGKGLDSFCPIGPYVVDRDSFLPIEKKQLITVVNGEERQRATFNLMVFSIPDIIETLSKGMTLEAGDIIATGTPKGVGKGFNPPKLLQKGDVVEIEIDGIGKLKNYFND
ncbi:fumarylacetoacetate hydrolase family protein [Evansella sp. AB-P1]|uniref:fumarylacetoacetate hydrolase family protein n=1 Tax=Evansella sp. AB-P1 TaxID=3037653 RepID=UPI00241DDA6D|nr:fumarylacetoacetate hydrolase family protein [Evansella sp. AB-P1]MDG5789202.1 fumarylacetoacetate hydrolase family protein [Evansella sp. AB-P1]